MQRVWALVASVWVALGMGGCASMEQANRQRQVASVLAYLYPGAESVLAAPTTVAEIRVPFRIGVAFVPDNAPAEFRLAESERIVLAGKVRDAFANYPFIREIVPVPSIYLDQGGGFANLERMAALLKLDVVALVSFDQVQHAGASGWSFLYWTGLGAYMIEGDQYDILTVVETTVFDVKSRQLLMRAGGMSNIKGAATMVGFAERAREARNKGFADAMTDMIANLHREVKAFRERAPKEPHIRLILPEGYDPAGAKSGR